MTRTRYGRRTFLLAGAALSLGGRARAEARSCAANHEQVVGPFYIDGVAERAQIALGHAGVPLTLRVALVRAGRCAPLPGAVLDVWHCDALGVYSGFDALPPRPPGPRPGPPPDGPPPTPPITNADRWLRGRRRADRDGVVEIATIYPGWYQDRAVHVHCKVHCGGHVAHVGQLFFPEEVTDAIARLPAYAAHAGTHLTRHAEDDIFTHQHGDESLVRIERVDPRRLERGLIATVRLAVDPDARPAPLWPPPR